MDLLVGIDASDLGRRALEETVARAIETGDALTIAIYGDPGARSDLHDEVRSRLSAADLDAEVLEIDGSADSRLAELLDGGPCDRLVIGGGVRSPMGKIRLGSVAEFVLTNATSTATPVR
jgi:nucleotide-binding universal stress UspA family protein